MGNTDWKEIAERLDVIIELLKKISKPTSTGRRIVDSIATEAGILGVISAVDVIKAWLGG